MADSLIIQIVLPGEQFGGARKRLLVTWHKTRYLVSTTEASAPERVTTDYASLVAALREAGSVRNPFWGRHRRGEAACFSREKRIVACNNCGNDVLQGVVEDLHHNSYCGAWCKDQSVNYYYWRPAIPRSGPEPGRCLPVETVA